MPVYNAERYLAKAIESVLNQTYSNFELLVIDDGSTDRSASIIEKYAQVDSRVCVYRQKNQGICSARNFGLQKSRGRYIIFCDHDDEYDSSFLKQAITNIQENNCVAVLWNYRYVKEINAQKKIVIPQKLSDGIYYRKEIVSAYAFLRSKWYRVWGAVYSRDFIEEAKIYFDTDAKFGGEDILFNAAVLQKAPMVAMKSCCVYTHYKRFKTSTSGKYDENRLHIIEKQIMDDVELCCAWYKDQELFLREYLFLFGDQLWTYLERLNHPDCPYCLKEKITLLKQIRENFYLDSKVSARNLLHVVQSFPLKHKIISIAWKGRAYRFLLFLSSCRRS